MAIIWHDTFDPDDEAAVDAALGIVRDRWADAPADDEQLIELLAVARGECEAYAPRETDPQHPGPEACRIAQLMHARNIWNASAVAPSGDFGEGSFTLTVHPLDWAITQRLRPKRATPIVG